MLRTAKAAAKAPAARPTASTSGTSPPVGPPCTPVGHTTCPDELPAPTTFSTLRAVGSKHKGRLRGLSTPIAPSPIAITARPTLAASTTLRKLRTRVKFLSHASWTQVSDAT